VNAFLIAIPRRGVRVPLRRAETLLATAGAPLVTPCAGTIDAIDGVEGGAEMRTYGTATSHRTGDGLLVGLAGGPELVKRANGCPAECVPVSARDLAAAWPAKGADALNVLSGGFAAAVWDVSARRLVLQMDGIGVQSLFVRVTEDAILACTEVTPLLAVGPSTPFDESALTDIMAMRFLAGSHTAWRGIRQVTPRRRCVVTLDGSIAESPVPGFAYDPHDPPPRLEPTTAALRSAMRASLERLRDAGVADVAVQLSGGVDSSICAALASKIFPRCTALTFRIDDFANPELPRARAVAERLGLSLHVAQVRSSDVARLHPWIIARVQEPPLHYNNPAVVRMLEDARDIAPDVIAGDFDTLFGTRIIGRVRRQIARRQAVAWLPSPALRAVSTLLRASGVDRLRRAAAPFDSTVPELIRRSNSLRITPEAAAALPAHARGEFPSEDLFEHIFDAHMPLEDAGDLLYARYVAGACVRRNTRFADALRLRFHYPMLDAAVMDIAASLPASLRWDPVRDEGKPLLHALCAELVGRDVSQWPKFGLPSPDLAWMEGPLGDRLAASLADDAPLAPYMDLRALRQLPRVANKETLWTVMTLDEVLRQGFRNMAT
jgi:asparagine synthase (glutamine-hydrolysing)